MASFGLQQASQSLALLDLRLRGVSRVLLLSTLFCLDVPSLSAQVTTEAGLNDLVILDPGKHERGLPAVIVEYMSGHPEIDIPPTVHVHRYYYSGDKIFQGPIIQGGPIVLVANHPKSGERMYVDVVLPPGTPRIQHTKNSISYIYSNKRVEVKFQHFPLRRSVAVVKHHSGRGIGLAVRDKRKQVRENVQEKMSNSEAVNSFKELARDGSELAKGAISSVGGLSTQGVDMVKQLAGSLPGVSYLKSMAEQGPQRKYESTIRNASHKNALTDSPLVRTNR